MVDQGMSGLLKINAIGEVLDRILGKVDDLATSDEERMQLRNEIEALRLDFARQMLDAELEVTRKRAEIIQSEAKGESWIQRNWRPVTALTFLVLIVLHHLGVLSIAITDQMWDLLQIMIGGYVVSRGIEKAAPAIAQAATRPPAPNP
jgi:tRNA G37 N-methylase TrmD